MCKTCDVKVTPFPDARNANPATYPNAKNSTRNIQECSSLLTRALPEPPRIRVRLRIRIDSAVVLAHMRAPNPERAKRKRVLALRDGVRVGALEGGVPAAHDGLAQVVEAVHGVGRVAGVRVGPVVAAVGVEEHAEDGVLRREGVLVCAVIGRGGGKWWGHIPSSGSGGRRTWRSSMGRKGRPSAVGAAVWTWWGRRRGRSLRPLDGFVLVQSSIFWCQSEEAVLHLPGINSAQLSSTRSRSFLVSVDMSTSGPYEESFHQTRGTLGTGEENVSQNLRIYVE